MKTKEQGAETVKSPLPTTTPRTCDYTADKGTRNVAAGSKIPRLNGN